jgi:hypothetical protein
MDSFSCDECRAIYYELREAFRPLHKATPQEIAGFLEGLDLQQCARMRVSSDMWKAWRRMQEHRVLTGHVVSPLGPGSALTSAN